MINRDDDDDDDDDSAFDRAINQTIISTMIITEYFVACVTESGSGKVEEDDNSNAPMLRIRPLRNYAPP